MGSTLSSDRVERVLAELRETGKREDGPAKLRVHAREAELGTSLYGRERADLGVNASFAITPEVGRLLYARALVARPAVIVEFGPSLGSSTIYLASALRDLGAGSIITTELLTEKAQQAASNLQRAGLNKLVEIRVGDALESLADLAVEVGLLFLDGSNDLYLPVARACRAAPVTERARDRRHEPRRSASRALPRSRQRSCVGLPDDRDSA